MGIWSKMLPGLYTDGLCRFDAASRMNIFHTALNFGQIYLPLFYPHFFHFYRHVKKTVFAPRLGHEMNPVCGWVAHMDRTVVQTKQKLSNNVIRIINIICYHLSPILRSPLPRLVSKSCSNKLVHTVFF